jgi:peptide/bleomycin uptake transporter
MFVSFFPKPKWFFISAAAWSLFGVLLWQFYAFNWGQFIGLPNAAEGTPPIIGYLAMFTAPHAWFFIYFWVMASLFALAWRIYSPHPWFWWAVPGSLVLVFVTYFQVQVSVAINDWYGFYYDLIQKALDGPTKGTITASQLYLGLMGFVSLAIVWISIIIVLDFYTKHYTFRWRTAMNNYYAENWQKLRVVEGAAQRVQEDTMRFATNLENLGISLINSVMTLIAFLPVLLRLSKQVTTLPIIGEIPYSLVFVSLFWAVFGTVLLAILGVRLPGLEFRNQKVEAAYRKELVLGEDNATKADPITLAELFKNVRKNYFKLFANYLYFNLGRYVYLQADSILSLFVLVPSMAAGAITFGFFQQVRSAFGEVRDAMQYLIKSWPSIVEMQSIYKRLRIFESAIEGNADIAADTKYGETA